MMKTPSSNNNRKHFVIWITLLTAWIIMTFVPPILEGKTRRLFADLGDRKVYLERGKWFTEGTLPISEYPPIPTLLFGINHLVSSLWMDTNMQLLVYVSFFSLEMLFVLFLVSKVLLDLLPLSFSHHVFLVLLPPTLWFTYNRFDILPAYLCLLAYSAATKRKWITVSIILAIATFTKWYPVLLFPGFFMYAMAIESKFQWKMVMGFTVTSAGIMLLAYLYGGPETVLAPYQFHMERGMEYVALPVLMDNFIHGLLGAHIRLPYFFLLFFLLQISAPIMIFFIKLDSLEGLVDYCIIVMGFFVLFSRIWSPQWFLWLLPFLIISAKNKKAVGLIVAYGVTAYLSFPIFFDAYGSSSSQLQFAGLLMYLILFVIILQSARNLKRRSKFADAKIAQMANGSYN